VYGSGGGAGGGAGGTGGMCVTQGYGANGYQGIVYIYET
jgi:hypothetical protein